MCWRKSRFVRGIMALAKSPMVTNIKAYVVSLKDKCKKLRQAGAKQPFPTCQYSQLVFFPFA
jgi:hypothetical protein